MIDIRVKKCWRLNGFYSNLASSFLDAGFLFLHSSVLNLVVVVVVVIFESIQIVCLNLFSCP